MGRRRVPAVAEHLEEEDGRGRDAVGEQPGAHRCVDRADGRKAQAGQRIGGSAQPHGVHVCVGNRQRPRRAVAQLHDV